MRADQPAVHAHRDDHFPTAPQLDGSVVPDELQKHAEAKGSELPAACLTGFNRAFPIKRRFVPLALSRFLCRFR